MKLVTFKVILKLHLEIKSLKASRRLFRKLIVNQNSHHPSNPFPHIDLTRQHPVVTHLATATDAR